MNDEDRNREERRREEKHREAEELQHRKGAEDDAGLYHEGLRSDDYSRWLARRGYVSSAAASEVGQSADDEASVIRPIDKQAWQQETMEALSDRSRLTAETIIGNCAEGQHLTR